jgi:hypothetical protein
MGRPISLPKWPVASWSIARVGVIDRSIPEVTSRLNASAHLSRSARERLPGPVNGQPERHTPPPAAWSADVQAVADANYRFALDLYARLRAGPGNLFLSPYGVHAALAMAAFDPQVADFSGLAGEGCLSRGWPTGRSWM